MKRFPELKPNFWDVIVVLAVIALAALSAMTVWRGGTETGALTAVVTADGQEIDRFAPADLLDAPRTYSYNGVTLTVAAEDGNGLRVSSSDCPTQDCVHTGTISGRASCVFRPGSSFSSPAARQTAAAWTL